MVRLTRAVVLQGISKVSIDKRDTLEIDKEFGRITHLHLQRKAITTLDSLHLFQSLTVLYLYENQISKIEGLECALNLEILHLQRNRLKRIENLLECKKLRKLYLGYNEIETVEGLHTLNKLEELHIEFQRLQNGMSLTFDPKSLSTLCNSLAVLNISGNNITHFEDLAGMEELHTLLATNNFVQDLESTALVVRTLTNLRVLDLQDNPISRKPQFKERIIGFCNNIAILNDKEISDTTRDFIQRFAAVKANRLQHAVNNFRRSSERIPKDNVHGGGPCGSSTSFADSPCYYGDCFSTSPSFRMTPTKSNLSLNVPDDPVPFHTFPHSQTGMSSNAHQSQNRQYFNNRTSTTPQFILAPPNFHNSHSSSSGLDIHPPMGSSSPNINKNFGRKSILKKRTSISIPTFKTKHEQGDDNSNNEETTASEDQSAPQQIFKNPKVKLSEMFNSAGSNSDLLSDTQSQQQQQFTTNQRAVVKLIKAPMTFPLRCSRQSIMEGMPMPSPSMLRMDQSPSSSIATGLHGHLSHINTHRVKKSTSGRRKMDGEESDKKETPPFTSSKYELPPWPHINRIFSNTNGSAVSFMP